MDYIANHTNIKDVTTEVIELFVKHVDLIISLPLEIAYIQ